LQALTTDLNIQFGQQRSRHQNACMSESKCQLLKA
jgi:hypothetical protein